LLFGAFNVNDLSAFIHTGFHIDAVRLRRLARFFVYEILWRGYRVVRAALPGA
jgi:hypothetical protein